MQLNKKGSLFALLDDLDNYINFLEPLFRKK